MIKTLSFYSRDHLSLPYMVPYDPGPGVPLDIDPNPTSNHEADDPDAEIVEQQEDFPVDYSNTFSEHRFLAPGRLNMRSEVLTRPWMQEYDAVRQTLLSYSTCSHSSGVDAICERCREQLQTSYHRIQSANPILSKLCEELSVERSFDASFLRRVAASAEKMVRLHMDGAKAFFEHLDYQMPEDCVSYWAKFGTSAADQIDADNEMTLAAFTGYVFPGRGKYRHDIRFDKYEMFDCNKLYVKSKRFTPGILTVQCCCNKPQLLGYIVMTRAESTGLALTSMLTNFQVPPRVVYYDNACNLVRSVITRVPWLMHLSKFMVDRFHYKSHTCSEIFDPDSYYSMGQDKSTTAESINARIEKSVPYLRFLKAENLIPHLNLRFALLNVTTRYRRMHQTDDLEDSDMWEYFKDSVACDCVVCSIDGHKCLEVRDLVDYGIVPEGGQQPAVEVHDAEIVPPPSHPAAQTDAVSSEDDRAAPYVDSEAMHVDAGIFN